MKANLTRLATQLAQSEFTMLWARELSHRAIFVRNAAQRELFETIEINADITGKKMYIDLGVSVIAGPNATKGLCVLKLLLEVAGDQSHGWTVIENDRQAEIWELQISRYAPRLVGDLVLEKGQELLNNTRVARLAAATYANLLKDYRQFESALSWVEDHATDVQKKQAERLAQWPAVVQIWNGLPIYKLAAMTLVVFGEQVEHRRFFDIDPIRDREVMWRLQTLVDLLTRADRIGEP